MDYDYHHQLVETSSLNLHGNKYEGVTEPDGTLKLTETIDEEDAPRPFKCYLNAGLKRISTGSRVFGAMKGASDGGIFIPHSEKCFPGYGPESKELLPSTWRVLRRKTMRSIHLPQIVMFY